MVPGYGIQTTIGGAGGEVVTAETLDQLKASLADDTPRIVRVKGLIKGPKNEENAFISVGSNKTIIGIDHNAKIIDTYLFADGVHNIIIRNLEITGGEDAISVRRSNHIWIDHVYVHSANDGLIDITRESDLFTVSWAELANHRKTMLLNAGSRHYDDRGKINGTIHHNFFNGTLERNPRAGFGKIHIFNDYNYANTTYGIGFHTESKVYAEQNYFKDTIDAINQMYNLPGYDPEELGDAIAVNNILDNSTGDESTGIGFNPNDYYMYDFLLDSAADVPDMVAAGAGPNATLSHIGLMPAPGQGAINVTDTTLNWYTGTYTPERYIIYFGDSESLEILDMTDETSYDVGPLEAGKTYYWRVDQITNNDIIEGRIWTFKAAE